MRRFVLAICVIAVSLVIARADAPTPLTLKDAMDRQAAGIAKVQIAEKALKDARTQADRIAADGDLRDAKSAFQKDLIAMRGLPIRLSGEAVAVESAPQEGFTLITLHVGNDVLVNVRAATADWPGLKRRDKIRVLGKIMGMYPPGPPNVEEAKPDSSGNAKDKPAGDR